MYLFFELIVPEVIKSGFDESSFNVITDHQLYHQVLDNLPFVSNSFACFAIFLISQDLEHYLIFHLYILINMYD